MAIAIGLLKMLLEVQHTRKTGALDVSGPGARVRVFVENGKVVFADEGTIGETLGRILVRERVLTHEQYASAIERMSEERAAGKPGKLGEVFVELGLLTPGQVHAALSAQVQQKVIRALAWTSATVRFVEVEGPLVVESRFDTPIEPLVVAALRLADRERIDELLDQARDRFVTLRGDREAVAPGSGLGGPAKPEVLARIDALHLPFAEHAFARALDGTRTVRELLSDENLSQTDRGVVLAALLLTDALDLRAEAPAVRPMALSSGSGAAAKLAEIAPVGSEPRRPRASSGSFASFASFASSEPRMPSEPRVAPLLAEKAYHTGKRLAHEHRLAEAVIELRRAASLYPAVEYDLWAAWAGARADARGENEHAERLRVIADLAIEQDTERGFATFVLAHLARRAGDIARADDLLARARAIDPDVDAFAFAAREPKPAREPAPAPAPERAATSEPEPERAPASARAPAPAARSRTWLFALLALAGLAVFIGTRARQPQTLDQPAPSPSPPAPSAPPAAASSPAVASASLASTAATFTSDDRSSDAAVDAHASDALPPDASYASTEASLPRVDGTRGALLLPSAADGHRVFVDGRVAGVPPAPIVVACGRHVVKIGSQGREQTLVIPCGGTRSVAYP